MTMWGGRFGEEVSDDTWEFTVDTSDRRLLLDDLEGSMGHVGMLGSTGILDPTQVSVIVEGLETIREEAVGGSFTFRNDDEDVHSAV
ncbi:MAG: argininosuccinate lyase, partial [Actinobacteria bacterium]|nr:argininosuccinate lyase [Actinomycetota bacterium]